MVQLKDYYAILAIEPSATTDEIKKAYRRLAHLYHPDKSSDDDYAAMKFADIKEAYEVLTNPGRKEDYLQQRWYLKSIGKKLRTDTRTPVSILKEMLALERYASRLDMHRMHHEGLYDQVMFLLSDENIQLLNTSSEQALNTEIAKRTITIAETLSFHYAELLTKRVSSIEAVDNEVIAKTAQLLQRKKMAEKWDKQKPWIMLVIVLLVCLMIYFVST